MAQLSREEHALVDELLDCVAEAIARLDDADVSVAYANKTKLQKLLYLAIQEFDLPVTYSWYLAGAVVPGDPATPSALESAFDDLPSTDGPSTPSPAEETASSASPDAAFELRNNLTADVTPEEVVGADDGEQTDDASLPEGSAPDADTDTDDSVMDPVLFTGPDPSPDEGGDEQTVGLGDRRGEVVDFYRAELPNVWHQNTMQFLQNFYLAHAPQAYRDLYVQSTHFRTRLRELEETVGAHVDGESPAQSIEGLVDAAGLDISEMHCTIRATDSLAATFDGFVHGTDLIEDGLMMLARRDPSSLGQEHVSAVRSMQEFFYYDVWRYPCLVISQETATGPSASLLRSERQQRLASFDEELRREAARFERELAEVGLKPDYTDYAAPDDEFDEAVSELADQYFE